MITFRLMSAFVSLVLDTVLTPMAKFLYWVIYHQSYSSINRSWRIKIEATTYGKTHREFDCYHVTFVANPSRLREPRILFPRVGYQNQYNQALDWFYQYLQKDWADKYHGPYYTTKRGEVLFYSKLKQIRLRILLEWLSWFAIFLTGVWFYYWLQLTWFVTRAPYINGVTIIEGTITFLCYFLGVEVLMSVIQYYKHCRDYNEMLQVAFNSTKKNLSKDRDWYYSIH